jgi:hypothetical protein
MRREKSHVNKIRNEMGEITIDTNEIQEIIWSYFINLYSNKLGNVKEMHKFLETYNQQKLNQKDLNHLNRSITSDGFEAAIESKQKKTRTQ